MVLSGDLSQTFITSARLALRAFKAADAAESFEEASTAIAQFMSWNPPASEKEFETIWQGRRTAYATVTSDSPVAVGLSGVVSEIDLEPRLFDFVPREAQLT